MIGKVSIGKSFGGVVRYVMEKEDAEVLDQSGVRTENAVVATQDFNAIRAQKQEIKNAVWHTSISFAQDDDLTSEEMTKIARDYLKETGLHDNQYLIVRHHDTKHEHIHIVSNRVGYDGHVVSDKWSKNRTAHTCDSLEEKYGLTVAKLQGRSKVVSEDKVLVKRQLKEELKTAIEASLQNGASNFKTLKAQLQERGINLELQIQSTGRVNGISFKKDGVAIKGSAIDRSYSYRGLASKLGQNKEISQSH
ncbi:MAG: relaxase/mobilization nuclease domain-containing protein [Cyclobacteriaceae bacterium]